MCSWFLLHVTEHLKMSTEGLTQRRGVEGGDHGAMKHGAPPPGRYRKASEMVRQPGVPSLLVAVSIPLVLGMIDGIVNSPGLWYTTLKKPWWNPPGFLFGLAWSVLYPVMGLASWLVWADGGFQKQGYPLTLYTIQLVLNLAWPALFFGSHAIVLALVDIVVLVVVIAMTVSAFQPVNYVAANLMKPYLTWVIFAAALNLSILLKNRGKY